MRTAALEGRGWVLRSMAYAPRHHWGSNGMADIGGPATAGGTPFFQHIWAWQSSTGSQRKQPITLCSHHQHPLTMIDLGPVDLIVPVVVIILAVIYIPITVFVHILTGDGKRLFSVDDFQQAWFQHFWTFFGYVSRPLFSPDIRRVVAQARGTVLDIGPGAGDWLHLLSPKRNGNITNVLLLEPNTNFHDILRRRAEQFGLTGRYKILGCKAEQLEQHGVRTQSIDPIITVHVLCSVEAPQALVRDLFRYLKTGGRWLVYEHVRSGGTVAATWQSMFGLRRKRNFTPDLSYVGILNTIWPIFLDGCSLTRDTERMLLQAGSWDAVDLGPGSCEGRFSQLPHVVGCLQKG